MRIYETRFPRVTECEYCDNDLRIDGSVVIVRPTSNPKRARQTFVCYGCAHDHGLLKGN